MCDANSTTDRNTDNGNTGYWHTLSIPNGAAANRDDIAPDRPPGRRCICTSHRDGQPNRPPGMHADPAANESARDRDTHRASDRACIRRSGCERGCCRHHRERRTTSGDVTGE